MASSSSSSSSWRSSCRDSKPERAKVIWPQFRYSFLHCTLTAVRRRSLKRTRPDSLSLWLSRKATCLASRRRIKLLVALAARKAFIKLPSRKRLKSCSSPCQDFHFHWALLRAHVLDQKQISNRHGLSFYWRAAFKLTSGRSATLAGLRQKFSYQTKRARLTTQLCALRQQITVSVRNVPSQSVVLDIHKICGYGKFKYTAAASKSWESAHRAFHLSLLLTPSINMAKAIVARWHNFRVPPARKSHQKEKCLHENVTGIHNEHWCCCCCLALIGQRSDTFWIDVAPM